MEENFFEVEHPTPLLPESQQADDAPQIDLEPQRPRPPSRRKRLAQISLVLVAVVAVVALLHSVLPPARSTSGATDTPIPTTPPPPATTLLLSNITFGAVTINGKQQQGTVPMFFEASSTTYRITITAPPFHPETCTIIFTDLGPQTNTRSSTCLVSDGTFPMMTINGVTATPLYLVEIEFSANDLPFDQQQQIDSVLAHADALQQTTTAPAGSYIATSLNADNTITSRLITSPLQATASLSVATSGESSLYPCAELICTVACDPTGCSSITGMTWLVGVPMTSNWRFATAGGRVVGDVSFSAVDVIEKLLAYDPVTGWSLSDQPLPDEISGANSIGSMDCETGSQVLQQLSQSATGFSSAISGGEGIEGCLITGGSTDTSNSGTFVWRFGVLLAADDTAHQSLPDLPIAPQAEIDAVQGT